MKTQASKQVKETAMEKDNSKMFKLINKDCIR